MDQRELDSRWFNFEPIEGVRFGLNDSVRILSGEHAGKGAAVISLVSTRPVTYLVELGFGGDIEIVETDLELLERHVQTETK